MTTTTGETQKIDLGTHRLRVRSSGAGARTLVCVHGLADTLAIWDELAPRLEPAARVVRYDQRAHGDSTAPTGACSREDLAADLVALLDRLEIDHAVVVGHSLGGVVALTAAIAAPARIAGLVLLGTASECNERAVRWYRDIVRAGEVNALEGLARSIYGPTSKNKVEGWAPGITAIARSLIALHEDPLTPRLGAISCPTAVLVGERDPMGTGAAEILRRNIPGATMQVVPGKGHWLQTDAPDVVVAAVAALGAPSQP
jgi:pimeloyl-ACP methyl ester carboxylesterase